MITHDAIDRYLDLLREDPDPVHLEMEQRAREHGFPIIGPHVGRLLENLVRVGGARRMLELGSGFGYSASWLLRGNSEGQVICTDSSEENRCLATDYLVRSGHGGRFRFLVGEADELLEGLDGPFDLVFNDVDKVGYPRLIEPVVARLRVGGVFVTDNVLWKGKVARSAAQDDATAAIREFNQRLSEHPQLSVCTLPLRDGVALAVKRG